jgi:predicted phosphodiesterase
MRTLIISDLHLGGNSATDVLRRADVREHLLAVAAQADRIVLLGDVLELRHGPMRLALAAARPFFQALGAAIQGGEIVLVAGNHDHALIDPWLASRGQEHEPPPLGVEQLIAPEQASEAYARIAGWCAPARVTVAYPGLWVRDDVCAMHGHFLDCHLTVPTLERLSVGAMSRVLGRHPSTFASVGDYEAAGAPVFAWRDAVARASRTGNALNGIATLNAWQALGGGSSRGGSSRGRGRGVRDALALRGLKRRARSTARRGALLAGFPLAIAALNRAGIGPLRATISRTELRRAGLSAMDEVAVRLGLSGSYVVFGHTHRTGPLPGDEHTEWTRASGVQLINTGSWTYSAVFLTPTPGESPYWPGGCVAVGDSGPPEVLRLLCDQTHAQLMRPLSPADA